MRPRLIAACSNSSRLARELRRSRSNAASGEGSSTGFAVHSAIAYQTRTNTAIVRR